MTPRRIRTIRWAAPRTTTDAHQFPNSDPMSAPVPQPIGLLAQFETAADILRRGRRPRCRLQEVGCLHPFPIHGMDDAMGLKKSKVGYFTFCGGLTGFSFGMWMIWFMNKADYPLVVGGKPLFTPCSRSRSATS